MRSADSTCRRSGELCSSKPQRVLMPNGEVRTRAAMIPFGCFCRHICVHSWAVEAANSYVLLSVVPCKPHAPSKSSAALGM